VVGVGFAFPITRDHGDVGDHGDSRVSAPPWWVLVLPFRLRAITAMSAITAIKSGSARWGKDK